MMLIGQTDESLQKFAWLLQTLAEDAVKDAETKFQLCNNLACVLNSETDEEIEYKKRCLTLSEMMPQFFLTPFIIGMIVFRTALNRM